MATPASSAAPARSAQPQLVLAKGEILLKPEGGTFVVPVRINDAITLDFTLDSGAADVSIPADVVSTLIRTGTITQGDFIGQKTFVLADGSTVPSAEFRIRTLTLGSLILHDVTGSVSNAKGALLLGQSFLARLSSWSIDNQRHVLQVSALETNADVAASVQATPVTDVGALPVAQPQQPPATQQVAAQQFEDPRAKAAARVTEILSAWSSPQDPSGTGVRRFYANPVNYYGAATDIDRVMLDKTKFAARWPVRNYSLRPGTVTVNCATPTDCTVQGVIGWQASDPSRGATSTGTAQFQYELRDGLIAHETSKVLSRN